MLRRTWKWVDGVGDAVSGGMQVKGDRGGRERKRDWPATGEGEQEDCAKEGATAAFRDREKWRRAIESEIGRAKG